MIGPFPQQRDTIVSKHIKHSALVGPPLWDVLCNTLHSEIAALYMQTIPTFL